jgi:hypothetical protein
MVVIIISLASALWIRSDSSLSGFDVDLLIVGLTIMLPIKLVTFVIGGLHKAWSHYTGMTDLARVYVVNVAASALSAVGIFIWVGPPFPRSAYFIDFLLCFLLSVFARFAGQLRNGSLARRVSHTEKDKTQQAYPPWIPNLLLTLTASLLALSAVLGVIVNNLATRSPELKDLSTTERQHLIQLASKIVPPVYQPFPLAGEFLFYHMAPNTHYTAVMGDTFTTNDLGFRTVPTSPKPKGLKRIVVVGDSWTYGQGVRYDVTFTYQLQKMLNLKGDRWQVYNLAMPGWNTANEIAALRTFFSQLQPDVVIFCPTSNDMDDSYDVWNGRLIRNGFISQASFRNSYLYHTRWIQVFKRLQNEVDWLKRQGVPSLIYFLAEWRKLAPYYASLAGLNAPYTVVPTKYIEKPYRLSPNIDAGEHATPEGNHLIAAYLHNALLEQKLASGLELLPINEDVVFPGHAFARADIEEEFRTGFRHLKRLDLIVLRDGFMGREGLFSVEAPSSARTVNVQLSLIDNPGLYPLSVEIGVQSAEQVSLVKVFDHFVAEPQIIEISKPASLDSYPIIEIRVTANRVVAPSNGLTPISMNRPKLQIR